MAKRPVTPAQDFDAVQAERLRAAHELLDERASPKVRAAVLRAAAESARGNPVSASGGAQRARRWFGWGPAAAAVTVAVGILAVGISVHVERETPTESRSETQAAPAMAAPHDEAKSTITPLPSAPRPPVAQDALRATKRDSERAAEAPVIAPAPMMQVVPPRPQAPAGEAAPVMQAAPSRAAAPLAKKLAPDEPRPAPPAAEASRARRSASPDEWLHRIIELRRAGRGAEADDELTRFRAAFPNVKVPDDALR
jgi:hypothetical protein